ncbi:carbonic anhydrase [Desulforhopalus vacuolatus]|uniref:carbonic anhydrase n=1 Tax=Desulforhopalus vacuolatus TaxID=40414 RepID=UPI00196545F4|nr:carbonic anhydrase [Desulforhopalus vacuolatus]MBM9518546.1 carbonic anhydrase [Desulforhopalus vacuolatus]
MVREEIYTADEALKILFEGNQRFMNCNITHKDHCGEALELHAERQQPLAVILTCADSRVPPLYIFDLGLGDLFVLRVAGGLVNDQMLGSIEYAVTHLQARLVMVMGHSSCGAITAVASGSRLGGHIATLIPPIDAALKVARNMEEGDLLDNASKELTRNICEKISSSEPIIHDLVKEGTVKVIPTFYNLSTGAVQLI